MTKNFSNMRRESPFTAVTGWHMDFITHNMSHGRVQQRSDDTTNTNSPEYDKEIERV